MLARLEAAIVIFESLGGPLLANAEWVSKECRMANTPSMRIVGEAMSALDEITFLARHNDRLVQPRLTSAEHD
jgi:hypothetical protein